MRKTLAMLLALMPAMSFAQDFVEVDGICYGLDKSKKKAYVEQNIITDGEYEIYVYEGDIVIPPYITVNGETYPVNGIHMGAFTYCENLKSVVLPEGLTVIDEGSFYNCKNMTSVTLPSTLAWIGEKAFYQCYNLTSIELPSALEHIGKEAFWECMQLTSINIPDGITTIEDYAFYGCESLLSIKIPSKVSSIGEGAFVDCLSLERIDIPASVTSIGEDAFAWCRSLTDVYYYATELTSKNSTISLFANSTVEDAVLHVPAAAIDKYRTTWPWATFRSIVSIEDEKLPQCYVPWISFDGNEMKLHCSTPGAQIHYSLGNVFDGGYNIYNGDTRSLNMVTVTLYATADGYRPSITVKYEVPVTLGIRGDVNQDGEVNVTDAVEVANIILKKK